MGLETIPSPADKTNIVKGLGFDWNNDCNNTWFIL